MEKYSREYREARAVKIKEMKVPHCEVTYSEDNLEGHHVVPKFFSGADVKQNLIILTKDFHAYIHSVLNVKDGELVHKRNFFAKQIYKNPNSIDVARHKERLDDIDDVLMAEWVQNNIMNISDKYREKVLEMTLLSHMKTIKELKIKLLQAEDKIARMEANNSTTHER